MSLKAIVQTLGGELYDAGCRANIPAPGHSRADRSVSLLLRDGRVVVHTFGEGNWRGVLEHLRARGLVDEGSTLTGLAPGGGRAANAGSRPCVGDRLAAARASGRTGGQSDARCPSVIAGCVALNGPSRGVTSCATTRRRRVSAYGESRRRRPALLVAMRGAWAG